jgi:hypothetical protein
MEIRKTIKYREGQKNLKEFYSLTYEEKKLYMKFLAELEESKRSDLDNHILATFYKEKLPGNKFLQLFD